MPGDGEGGAGQLGLAGSLQQQQGDAAMQDLGVVGQPVRGLADPVMGEADAAVAGHHQPFRHGVVEDPPQRRVVQAEHGAEQLGIDLHAQAGAGGHHAPQLRRQMADAVRQEADHVVGRLHRRDAVQVPAPGRADRAGVAQMAQQLAGEQRVAQGLGVHQGGGRRRLVRLAAIGGDQHGLDIRRRQRLQGDAAQPGQRVERVPQRRLRIPVAAGADQQ